ncbi:MAG: cupredoxin domain-containing protein [Nitrospirae bacterium]|nr:cupredoxin domain-containing protein [Nitrospirota bacterium]
MRRIPIIAMLVTGAGWIAACGGPGTSEISTAMTEFAFTPSSSSVSAGSEVTLTLTNDGTVDHNWVLMDAGYTVTTPFDEADRAKVFAETTLAAGDSTTFTFTAPSEAGTYQVVCSIPGHLEAGMEASLTVP